MQTRQEPAARRRRAVWAFPRVAALLALAVATPVSAQRAGENALTQAQDAFGATVGSERTGLYTDTEVRGFSPIVAGNARIDGRYFDRQAPISSRLFVGSTIRVGLTAQSYPFTAPTGVVDYRIRPLSGATALSIGVAAGPFEGRQLDLDIETAPTSSLSLGAGVALRREAQTPGDVADLRSGAILARWRPLPGVEVLPFWSIVTWRDDLALPRILPAGPALPHAPREYHGQPWTRAAGEGQTYGVLARAPLPEAWSLRLGYFRSDYDDDINFTDAFRRVDASGIGERVVTAEARDFHSRSGELRATHEFATGSLRHVIHLAARGRTLSGSSGGARAFSFGAQDIHDARVSPAPVIVLGPRSRQHVDQSSAGLSYGGNWARRGELTIGVQRVRYEKRVTTPGAGESRSSDNPWLVSATAAVFLNQQFTAYGGFNTGLEESGTAPEIATNFPETLPAARTRQADAGVRWAPAAGHRIVVGAFELHKPYFNLDRSGRFSELGDVVHRGLELSVSGRWNDRLTTLAGAIISEARVVAQSSATTIGRRPVGIPQRTLRFGADYRLPDGVTSLDVNLAHIGGRPVDTANLIRVPDYTVVDVGARRRFTIRGNPATLRMLIANVGDTYGWRVLPGGSIQPLEPRRVSISLLADF